MQEYYGFRIFYSDLGRGKGIDVIVRLRDNVSDVMISELDQWFSDKDIETKKVSLYGKNYLVSSAGNGTDLSVISSLGAVEHIVDTGTEYQLCERKFRKDNTVIDLGDDIVFGSDKTVMMAGPCAVESEDQAMRTAEYLVGKCGVKVFRAGAFKPRTSPYAFQGMEYEGLKILDKVRREFGLKIITEVKDPTHFDAVADCADIVQVGTKSMYIFNLLSMCGKIKKPVLLKRGFMATVKEFLQAADVVLANGNPDVILCERGIRTFETKTRFCLDVCSAALIKDISHLPIVLDPSHAVGVAEQVPAVALSAAALSVDGLMIEVHPAPDSAKCDRSQALSLERFNGTLKKLKGVCAVVERDLV